MARKPADPTARLTILLAARDRIVADDVLKAEDMARAAGMTWRNLRMTIDADPDLPIISRGGEGIAWQFDPAAVLDHLIGKARAAIGAREAHDAKVARIAGVELPVLQGGSRLTLDDIATIDRFQREAQRRKIEQRDYVKRSEVESLLTALFSTVQGEVISRAGKLDPAGLWPPSVRAAVIEEDRSMLLRIHDLVGEWVKDDPRPTRRPGSGTRSTRNRRVHGEGARPSA